MYTLILCSLVIGLVIAFHRFVGLFCIFMRINILIAVHVRSVQVSSLSMVMVLDMHDYTTHSASSRATDVYETTTVTCHYSSGIQVLTNC